MEESLAMKWSRLASAMASASTNSTMALRRASVVSPTAALGRKEPSLVSGACFTNANIAKTGDEQSDVSHQSCNWHAAAYKSDRGQLNEVRLRCVFATAYITKLVAGRRYERLRKQAHSAGNPRRKAPSRA